jgi:hypothetical protein
MPGNSCDDPTPPTTRAPSSDHGNVRVVVPMPAAPALGHRPNGQIVDAALCGPTGAIMCRRRGVAGETEVTA